jgi:4-amino-4-deoxy-L-arabinose transferase-like glycosyltransferase
MEMVPRRTWPRRAISLPLALLAALVLARLAVSAWWLIVDEGVLDTESGRHLQRAWDGYVAMGNGDLLHFFKSPTEYPPLLYLIGNLGALVGGLDVESFLGAQDLLMLPALAIGCYGAGTIAYGPTAGLLAAVFALGAPMAVSVFQMFLVDTTEAAMVALSVWAILATNRFSRVGVSALAGVAVGLGMLAKQNFPLFVAGLLLVVFLRGGWRHWRGLLVFAVVAGLLTATWYWSEVARTLDLVRGASGTAASPATAAANTPVRWTAKNFAWYGWSTLNVSVLLPLTLATLGGCAALLVRYLRNPSKADLTPELLAGGVVSYAGLTWIVLKDPRYALPALPYMAVLGTGWITMLRARWRVVAIAAISAIALVNIVGTFAGTGTQVRISLPGAPHSGLGEREFTLYSPGGWITGAPEKTGAATDVMRAAKAAGIEAIAFDPGANQAHFNHPGLDIMSRVAGMPIAIPYDPSNPRQAMLSNHYPATPQACAVQSDGVGIYLVKGPFELPFEQRRLWCPPGLHRSG